MRKTKFEFFTFPFMLMGHFRIVGVKGAKKIQYQTEFNRRTLLEICKIGQPKKVPFFHGCIGFLGYWEI